jgi:hypothetical protein
MKTQRTKYQRAALLIVAFTSLIGHVAHAQLNEKKIERDATGVYKGSATGGTVSVSYDTTPQYNFSEAAYPYAGKVKVPVKDGKLSTKVNDGDLPDDGSAALKGKEQKSKVTRGGKKIAVKAKGSGFGIEDNPYHGPWLGGKISGNLTDKGSKWKAKTKLGAYQRNGSPVADHTKTVTGYNLKGVH